jgi:hypothetical protein
MNRVFLVAAGLLAPAEVMAQVGHAPERSPYRDLRAKQAASFFGGYLGGSRGAVSVGPAGGPLVGIRYDHIIGTPFDIHLGLSYAHLKRFVVDPTRPVATRTTGPVFQDLVMMETGMSLVVMGRKTWRGFSPFVGGTMGIAFETGLSTEASGYRFGTKFMFNPHIGLKWFPVQAFSLKIEGRDYVWRLSYPDQYAVTVVTGLPPVLPAGTRLTEWTHHPTLLVSVGYTFTF